MFLEQRDRRIVPRWRDFKTTLALGELDDRRPPMPVSVVDQDALTRLASEWQKHRTIWHAADLLSSSFVLGVSDKFRDAAVFVLENRKSAPSTLASLAEMVLQGSRASEPGEVESVKEDRISQSIHGLRKRVRDEPRNALLWAELSRLYTLRGQREQALRSMSIAAGLGPDSRFIVRSAARLFLREHDARKGLRIIRGASGAKSDPWLLSAEIAIASASGVPSALAKIGRSRNEDNGLSLFARTELSSALATLELENGKNRHARQLFRQSLAAPNENSVAQVEWANRKIGGLEVEPESVLSVPRSFEAAAQLNLVNGQWTDAVSNGANWLKDQPFSKQPAIFTSYVSSLIEEYGWSIELLHQSLRVNPHDESLLNNLAFALASANRIPEALAVLDQTDYRTVTGLSAITLAATHGLVLFRMGNTDGGRELYRLAIERARELGIENYRTMARLYLAREELLANTTQAASVAKEAVATASKSTEKDVLLIAEQVSTLLAKATAASV